MRVESASVAAPGSGSGAASERVPTSRTELLLILAFWTFMAILASANALLDPRGRAMQSAVPTAPLAVAFAQSYLWAALTPLVFRLASRFRLERSNWVAHVVVFLVVGLVAAMFVEQMITFLRLAIFEPPRRFRNLGPFAGITRLWFLDDSRQVKASYSRRIERPRTGALNPFTSFDDPLNLFSGNPRLQPEYTNAFELGFQQSGERGTFQVTPFYRHTTDAVRRITTLVDSVSTTTPQNVATSDSYGADVNGSLRLGRITGFGGVSAYRQVTDGSNLGSNVGSDAIGWSARINTTYQVSPRLDAQAFFMYRAPMNTEQGRVSSRSMVNLALRQKLMGDRASLSVRVVDPFNTMGFGSRTTDERFYLETERDFGARGVFATFSMTFGRPPRIQQPRPEQPDLPDENRD